MYHVSWRHHKSRDTLCTQCFIALFDQDHNTVWHSRQAFLALCVSPEACQKITWWSGKVNPPFKTGQFHSCAVGKTRVNCIWIDKMTRAKIHTVWWFELDYLLAHQLSYDIICYCDVEVVKGLTTNAGQTSVCVGHCCCISLLIPDSNLLFGIFPRFPKILIVLSYLF